MKPFVVNASICVSCLVAGLWLLANRPPSTWPVFSELHASKPVTYTLKKSSFMIEAPAFGELEAGSSTSISVPQVRTGGLKVFWIVKDGSTVKKGDTLVEFDASELIQQSQETTGSLEATLRQLEVAVLRGNSDAGQIVVDREIAGMELEKAKTQAPKDTEIFTRNEIIEGELNIDLSGTKVSELGGKVSAKEDLNETSQRILVIERKQHEQKRDMLQQSLGSLKILAPHDGLVLHKRQGWWMEGTSVGDTRWPGTTILTIPDISNLKARVYVLEADAGNLKAGQKGTITVDSHPGRRFDVVVERVETVARPLEKDSPVKYFEVRLKTDAAGAGEILRPGKMVQARITVARLDDVLVVPRSALTDENRRFFVWVDRPQAPEKREVRIGSGDGARIAVLSGVSEGESVLLNPPRSGVAAKGNQAVAASRLAGGQGQQQ